MKKTDKTYLFESMPVRRAVLSLALPMVAVSLVNILYSLADTWFVGMLNDPVQNAAVTLASPLTLAFYAINNLFGGGTSSMMGRALGRRDEDTAKRCAAFGFWAAFVSAALFAICYAVFSGGILSLLGAEGENRAATADYLFWTVTVGAVPSIINVILGYLVRCEGAAVHAAIGTMSGCVLNIILDPVFVLPGMLNMGAAGAGCATFISNTAACIYFLVLIYIRRRNTCVCLKPAMAKPRRAIVTGICAVGVPASIQNLLNVTGMTILNNFVAGYGITSAVAAVGIAYKVHMIPMQISFGMSGGIMPLLSYNYGSGDYSRARRATAFTGATLFSFLVICTALFCAFARQLMGAFTQVDDIITYGTGFLKVMMIAIPFQCIDFLGVNVYQSFGHGRLSLIYAIMRKIVLEIPLLLIINSTLGLMYLPCAQVIAEIALCFGALFTLRRIFRQLGPGKPRTMAEQ